VEFFEDTNSLGVVTTPPVIFITNSYCVFPVRTPYCLTWSNVVPGAYTLTAVATDNDGATATSAPVNISVVTNLPPRVQIENPHDGSTFRAPANIGICAEASDPDGTVTSVELFAGTNSLGVLTNAVLVTNRCEIESLYCLTWSNVSAGAFALTAVATDNDGLTATSAPVNVAVLPPPPPTVKIVRPRNGSTIRHAPVNINICAVEKHFTHPVVSVEFFSGTTSVGVTTNAPYSCIVWSNVPPGAYSLTAVATESTSATVTSAPVGITVIANPPHWRW
jgi:hypothetical protein